VMLINQVGRLITDYYSIKKLNENSFKIIYLKQPIQTPGYEREKINRDINDKKLDNSISRSRTRIFEYSMCNKFEYFITLSLNGEKKNRYELKPFIKDLGQFIRDYRKKYKVDIQYILIPEKHKDGAWHMHGLIKGIPESHLHINDNGYLDWKAYKDKFGWISLGKVKNQEAVSKYITKYITKSFNSNMGVIEKEQKLYYVTRGLKKPEVIKKGSLPTRQLEAIPWTYKNEYFNECLCNKKTLQQHFNIDLDY